MRGAAPDLAPTAAAASGEASPVPPPAADSPEGDATPMTPPDSLPPSPPPAAALPERDMTPATPPDSLPLLPSEWGASPAAVLVWRDCRALLTDAGIENAAWELDWLWQAVTGQDRHLLPAGAVLPQPAAQTLWQMCTRRAAHWPLQYLLGRWPFLQLELRVAPGVLIPRQDSECVAECAIEYGCALQAAGLLPPAGERLPAGPLFTENIQTSSGTTPPAGEENIPFFIENDPAGAVPATVPSTYPLCLDLCAGSGALGLAVGAALRIPVVAVEVSKAALPVLRANAADICRQQALPPLQVLEADVFAFQDRLPPASVGLLVANPPYLTADELQTLQPEVRYEPRMALDGGADGLVFYRHLAAAYRRCMVPGGVMVLEIGAAQARDVCALLAAAGWQDIRVRQDLAGHDRCVCARRGGQDIA